MTDTTLRYVLITPARNEARFIELAITCVVRQTVRPARWVIVDDGSTDDTATIVRRYLLDHPWIELLTMPPRRERTFAGKVHAFDAGYARARDVEHDVVASMDADISFEEDYFAFLLARLAEDPGLGLVGTPFVDTTMYDYRFVSVDHVSGACQVFRRTCFEAIGGYTPVRSGGIDHIAVLQARSSGWRTRTFTDKVCHHHRVIGTAERGVYHARLRTGTVDYALGSHPLWQVCRAAYQMTRQPGTSSAACCCWPATSALRCAGRSARFRPIWSASAGVNRWPDSGPSLDVHSRCPRGLGDGRTGTPHRQRR